MANCLCVVQAGQTPDTRQAQLTEALNGFSRQNFGEPADITWMAVPEGSGFTAGEPSTSSVVSFTADQPLEQSRRIALLTALSDLWMGGTGCSHDELVAVINDPR